MSPEILDIIQRSLDTIDSRMRGELTVQELAAEAGFSLHHFEHVFKAVTGLSVGRYITRRRLLHAAFAMKSGMRAIDAALAWGFDTHAGFYKAFRREFGCAPSVYVKTHRASRPARVNLKEEGKMTDLGLITRALAAWGMADAPVSRFYYANTGRCSDNTFAVGETHCLRASTRPGELARLAALQEAMAAQGLSAQVLPTLAGEKLARLEGTDFLLMERLPGAPVPSAELLKKPEAARALGEGLARLHAALRTCDPLLCQEEDLAATLRDWAIPTAREVLADTAWMDDFALRVETAFPKLPVQIIHRDPNPDNIFMADGRVTGFLDFELTRIMPRIFDLCYAATGILSTVWQEKALRPAFFDAARAIWQGYDSLSPLTEAEKAALPDMVLAIQLICVAAFAGSEKLRQLYDTNVEMLAFVKNEALHM